MRKYLFSALTILALASSCVLSAQDNPSTKAEHQPENTTSKRDSDEAKLFRINFVVKQLENGKVTNIRSYSSLANTQAKSLNLRTSSSASGLENRISIDTYGFAVKGNELTFSISIDLGDMNTPPTNPGGSNVSTVKSQNRWSSAVQIVFGKNTIVYTADDPSSKKSVQLEVTATLL